MVSALSLSRAFAFALAFGLISLQGPADAQTRAAPTTATAAQIDLNSASQSDLMALDGIGEVRADAIIRARPFKAKTELVERRIIPEALYDKIADKLTVRLLPPPPPVAPKR